MRGRVLIVAGSDSGGGAGIQADIKTVTAFGGFAMTAVTALTAQNTLGVHGVVGIDPAFIRQQIDVVVGDLGVDAIKTGMLHSRAVIETVAGAIRDLAPETPLVVDPVMVAKGGAPLLEDDAVATLRDLLLPLATVITPNLPEAGVLLGRDVSDFDSMEGLPRPCSLSARKQSCSRAGIWKAMSSSTFLRPRGRHRLAGQRRRSIRCTPTERAAPWPRPSRPAWRRAWTWNRRCPAPGITCAKPSSPRPATAPGMGRSTTLTGSLPHK